MLSSSLNQTWSDHKKEEACSNPSTKCISSFPNTQFKSYYILYILNAISTHSIQKLKSTIHIFEFPYLNMKLIIAELLTRLVNVTYEHFAIEGIFFGKQPEISKPTGLLAALLVDHARKGTIWLKKIFFTLLVINR